MNVFSIGSNGGLVGLRQRLTFDVSTEVSDDDCKTVTIPAGESSEVPAQYVFVISGVATSGDGETVGAGGFISSTRPFKLTANRDTKLFLMGVFEAMEGGGDE